MVIMGVKTESTLAQKKKQQNNSVVSDLRKKNIPDDAATHFISHESG